MSQTAAYLQRLIRPDLALFDNPKRSWWRGLMFRAADRELARLLDYAPGASPDRVMARALDWTYRRILPSPHGPAHIPQTVAETLREMAGDCDEGAVLLGSLVVSLCPEASDRLAVVVTGRTGQWEHCALEWTDDGGAVRVADWTESGEFLP